MVASLCRILGNKALYLGVLFLFFYFFIFLFLFYFPLSPSKFRFYVLEMV